MAAPERAAVGATVARLIAVRLDCLLPAACCLRTVAQTARAARDEPVGGSTRTEMRATATGLTVYSVRALGANCRSLKLFLMGLSVNGA